MKESLNQISGQTVNFRSELSSKLAEYAPEVVSDGEIDFEKVKELLASDVSDDRKRY